MTHEAPATDVASDAVTLTVIADEADVRLLNRYFNDRVTRMMREPGLVAPIGTALSGTALAAGTRLHAYSAKLSAEGHERFATAAHSFGDARSISLSTGETVGLLLSWWRCHYLAEYQGTPAKDYSLSIEAFGRLKAAQSRAAGSGTDADRIMEQARALRLAFDAQQRADSLLATEIGGVFRPRQ